MISREIAPEIRVFATGILVSLAYLAGRVLLPGIDSERWSQLSALAQPADGNAASVSVFALGLRPMVTGFFIVELLAIIVPPWRRLRADGTAGRRKLTRAALIFSLLLAVMQGYFVARWLEGTAGRDPSLSIFAAELVPGWSMIAALTLAGGSAALWVLAGLINRIGIGNGVAILIGTQALLELFRSARQTAVLFLSGSIAPVAVGQMLLLSVVVALGTWVMLRGSDSKLANETAQTPAIQQPITSLMPLQASVSILMLMISMANLGWISPDWVEPLSPGRSAYHVAHLLLLGGLALFCGWAFSRPTARFHPQLDPRRRAILIGVLYMFALWGVSTLIARLHLPASPNPLSIVVVAAIGLDLLTEWQARKTQRDLSPIWCAPDPESAAAVCIELRSAGIFAITRGFYQRSLWRLFGAVYALDILVSKADAERARGLIASS